MVSTEGYCSSAHRDGGRGDIKGKSWQVLPQRKLYIIKHARERVCVCVWGGGYVLSTGGVEKPALKTCTQSIFDFQIISYTGGQMHQYGDPGISSRFRFTGSPTQGDASIAISDVRVSDTATYQCKVKKAPGVDMRKVTLVVMGEQDCFILCSTCQTCSLLKRCRLSHGMCRAVNAPFSSTPLIVSLYHTHLLLPEAPQLDSKYCFH